MQISDILKRPYHWVVVPEDDGSFFGRIAEFPGCIATGNTAVEAITNLADVAESWLEATMEQGQTIPKPREEIDDRRSPTSRALAILGNGEWSDPEELDSLFAKAGIRIVDTSTISNGERDGR